jgi:hypothetical protein
MAGRIFSSSICMIIDDSMGCHAEPFDFAQDKLREETPKQLSQEAQLLGDSHLHGLPSKPRAMPVSLPSVVQNDIRV